MKNKLTIIVIILILILSIIFISGCDVQISESKDDNLLTTEKTTESIGTSGYKTETETCPFWNRDC